MSIYNYNLKMSKAKRNEDHFRVTHKCQNKMQRNAINCINYHH